MIKMNLMAEIKNARLSLVAMETNLNLLLRLVMSGHHQAISDISDDLSEKTKVFFPEAYKVFDNVEQAIANTIITVRDESFDVKSLEETLDGLGYFDDVEEEEGEEEESEEESEDEESEEESEEEESDEKSEEDNQVPI